MERKSVPLEVKDIDKSKRTTVVAHATYNSIDRVEDIARKGMFTRSWNAGKEDIAFYLNHDDTQAPGKVVDVFEDDKHAYTKAWLGTHTLGNDTLIMLDEGVIKNVSFGYIATQKAYTTINGRKVRELKEVKHIETSVLTKMQAHPDSRVVSVVKAFKQDLELKLLSQEEVDLLQMIAVSDMNILRSLMEVAAGLDSTSDLYTWIMWNISRRAEQIGGYRDQLRWDAREKAQIKSYIHTAESFCRNTKASDDCIKTVEAELQQAKALLSEYDTTDTSLITNPSASRNDNSDFRKRLLLLNLSLKNS